MSTSRAQPNAATAGPGLEPREVSVAAATVFFLIAASAVMPVASRTSSAAVRTPYGGDFAEFYIAGKILNQYGAHSLYDLDLQTRLYRSLDPRNRNDSVWYVCGPFLAPLFRPFALLSFPEAYLAWMVVAVLIFGIGVRALWPYLTDLPPPHRSAAILIGLSFAPFAVWSFVGGQIGVIAFAIIAWCVRFDLNGKHALAGATLALCCYKPTLLLLFGPFFLMRMNLRLLFGFAAGLGGIVGVTLLTIGTEVIAAWLRIMFAYGGFVSGGNTPWPTAWPQLIDLNHFMRRFTTPDSRLPTVLAAVAFVAVVAILSRFWRGFDTATQERRQLTWAVTITASLLANFYVMIYDTVSIVAGALLTASVICRQGDDGKLTRRFRALLALVYFTALLTALVPARYIALLHVHVYTLALAALAVFQYRLLGRLAKGSPLAASPGALTHR